MMVIVLSLYLIVHIAEQNVIQIEKDKLRSVLASQTGTRAEGILRFHDDHIDEILSAKGSSGGNHQNWEGGLHDHLHHCFVLAQDLYKLLHERIGPGQSDRTSAVVYRRAVQESGVYPGPFPFSLESAIVVLYFHDIEKIFKYGNRYPQRLIESKDAWYLGILPNKYGIEFDEQEYNALKYAHGEGNDHRKDRRVASPLAGFVHSIDNLSARVLWNVRDFDYGPTSEQSLYNTCRSAVGKKIRYTGKNGNESDKVNHGSYVEGQGVCMSQHDSHGFCIMVQHEDQSVLCVEPISVQIIGDR